MSGFPRSLLEIGQSGFHPERPDRFRPTGDIGSGVGYAASFVAAVLARWQYVPMEIRDGRAEDAPAACLVLRRSIVELCAADHRNDPAILERWLRNKTPESLKSWITQPGNSVLVAVEDDDILAVGSVTDEGKITLNYVSPDARFRGISRALLSALEARAAERGNVRCTLISTETARLFYHANGYTDDRLPVGEFGTQAGYPMVKHLLLRGL